MLYVNVESKIYSLPAIVIITTTSTSAAGLNYYEFPKAWPALLWERDSSSKIKSQKK